MQAMMHMAAAIARTSTAPDLYPPSQEGLAGELGEVNLPSPRLLRHPSDGARRDRHRPTESDGYGTPWVIKSNLAPFPEAVGIEIGPHGPVLLDHAPKAHID
jgi:hypothetical protein